MQNIYCWYKMEKYPSLVNEEIRWRFNIWFVSHVTEINDIWTYSGRRDFNVSFYTISGWIVNFNASYVESENGRKWDEFLIIIYFQKEKNNLQTAKKIDTTYRDGAILESTVGVLDSEVNTFIWINRERSSGLQSLIMTKSKFWLKLIKVTRYGISQWYSTCFIWVYENNWIREWLQCLCATRFKGDILMICISMYDSFLKRNRNNSSFKETTTGDEKWNAYSNVKRKWSWGKRNEPPSICSSSEVGNGVYLVWLKSHCLLEARSAKSNIHFSKILFPVRQRQQSNSLFL